MLDNNDDELEKRKERARQLRNSVGMVTNNDIEKDTNIIKNNIKQNLSGSNISLTNDSLNSLSDSIFEISKEYQNTDSEYQQKLQRAKELRNSVGMITGKDTTNQEEEKQRKEKELKNKFNETLSVYNNVNDNRVIINNEEKFLNNNYYNQNANHRFRVNENKTKQEIDKQIQQASFQGINENISQNKQLVDKDIKIGLASNNETTNVQNLSTSDFQAMKKANEKNKNIEKGGLAKFEETIDTVLNNIFYGGLKQTVSGLVNILTSATGVGIRGLEGASKIIGLDEQAKNLNNAYNSVIDFGNSINENATHEQKVNSQIENDLIRTAGEVTNIVSNMIGSTVMAYALPINISPTAIQGLSVGGSSAQEVLNENKDNIVQATLTGIAKGYSSYITEKMFNANILTRGTKKTSLEKSINHLISNKINSDFGKEFANRTVGIIGENIEELVDNNLGYLVDKLVNKKDLPDFKEWLNEQSETVKSTTLSTIIMSLLGLGGTSFKEIENDMNSQYWIDQAQQIIDQENLAIHFNPNEVKNINNIKDFYITRFTPEGEIANIVPTKGKTIYNSKSELKVNPVVVLNSETNMYNVIDGNTGVVLDSTPYSTTMQAEGGYNEKANKLSNLQIQDINKKINNADYMITNEIVNTITQAKEQLNQMTLADYNLNKISQDNINQTANPKAKDLRVAIEQIQDNTYYNTEKTNEIMKTMSDNFDNVTYTPKGKGSIFAIKNNKGQTVYSKEIRNNIGYSGKNIKNILSNVYNSVMKNNDTNVNSNQRASEPNASNFYTNETNYAVKDIKKVTEPFNKQKNYSKEKLAEIWNNEVFDYNYDAYFDENGNIERYIAIEEDEDNIVVNQYDNNDNILKSEVIPTENGRYSAKTVKDTIERVSNLYDENRPIKGQRDIEGNEVLSIKKKIENEKDTKITNKIKEYIIKNPDLETDINVSTEIIEDINIDKIKQMEAYKIARDLFSEIHKRKFYNNNTNTNIYVTNSDIKESLNTTYTYTEQRKYLKENIVIYSQLDKIIENAKLISNTSELKGRKQYQQWEYYALPINIDNNKFIIQFDTVKREDGETHFRVERLYKIINEGNSTTVVPTKKLATRFTVELPSDTNSISQNTKSVKNNTATKQSMQNDENNTIQNDIENFSNQVDEVLAGTFPKNSMLTLLKETPKPLQDIGLANLPITMTQKHLNTIINETGTDTSVNYHGLGIERIKQLPEAINNPLDIVKSNTRSDSIVLTTYLADSLDRTIIASVKINGKGTINDIRIDTNVMTSAYGRNNYEAWMDKNLKEGKLLYDIDRGVIKKVTGARLQLPRSSNSTTKTYGSNSNNIIPPTNNNVKNDKNVSYTKDYMQNDENNTQEQQKIQKELHNRIANALLSKNTKKNTYLGEVTEKVAKKVKSLLGIDVTGRKHIIPDYNIRHIINQHGNPEIEKTKGQIAVTKKDIEKIPDILSDYDRIEKGSINTNSITSSYNESIRYIKKYNNNIIYVVEVVPKTGKTLEIKTMWKKPITLTNSKNTPSSTSKTRGNNVKSTLKKEPVGLSYGNNTLPYTSETKSDIGSITSISQNSQNVKDDSVRAMKKNTSKNRTNVNNNTNNLIAQHNTSEEKLMEALNLGALPVPSIAITKSNTPISNYGDITLLFNKDTINPTDKRNVAYNSDIYSTRKPQTVNSLDKTKVKAFENSMNNKGISYGYISQIEEDIQDNDLTRAKDTIRYELQKVNPDVTEQDIEDSFTEAMEIIKDKRILKEGVDPYMPSGNRKSIEQMSVPYTLDNIVRLMTKKSNKGSESNNFAGLAEVRANLSQQFKNIEEMHKQESNLVSTEKMQKVKEELNNEFYNLIDEIGKYDKIERYFGSADTVANALNETAKAKNISKEVLENELDFVSITDVPDKILQKAVDFLNSLKNVPTEYFEVKPQRAVGLNEIQSAIVPKNTSKELIDKLKENNIPVTYYNTVQERDKLISNETKNKDIRFAKRTAKPKEEVIEPGATNAQRDTNYIEQEIRKIEESGKWDESIPVTKMTDIRKTIENYLGLGIQKGHFRQQAYGIYKGNRDVIRTKELKDIDTILHETGHALDIGKRIKIDKESIANELLKAVNNYGGYETESRKIRLEEGFAEVIRMYTIVPEQAKIEYPQTVSVLEGIRKENADFDNFIRKVQEQTYNYIHQRPRNRGGLSNMSIGEQTDKMPLTPESIRQRVIENAWDSNYSIKRAVEVLQKKGNSQELKASENAYLLTRLTSGIGDKITSMLSNGYIDENGNKLFPGLNQLGELLNNDIERFNDLRAYLVAQRDLEYKAKKLKTGIRTMDSKAIVEEFKNDTQIQEASKIIYATLDGVLQYAVNNKLITPNNAKALRESNTFYVPMQRVLGTNGNNVGRKGAVADIIRARTGSELDIKDVLENIVTNSANIIQQVENNSVIKAFYNQGESVGLTGNIYDEIDPPMKKIGTTNLEIWKSELESQGVDIDKIDFDKTIDIFVPNNNIDEKNQIVSFIDNRGQRRYLQFHDEILFKTLTGLDRESTSRILNFFDKLNKPLRYGATLGNLGFALPNMLSDTVQASIYSEAGFIPIIDTAIGTLDVLASKNRTVRNFMNKVAPQYADKVNMMYYLYEQSGATSATKIGQERKSAQMLMKDIYGTNNSKSLGIKENFKPLKRLLNIMTYIPELSEQSTRFRVFEKNLEYYRRNGMEEIDARIQAALQSRDATQDFSRMGKSMREINKLVPFSAARVGSSYTFLEKIQDNPKRTSMRIAVLMAISMGIKALTSDDDEINELNQRKKDDNFVFKMGEQIITIKKPQGILRSMINLSDYIIDLTSGNIEEGKEGERLAEWLCNAIMDNSIADDVTGLVPSAITPIVENAINKDFYYNTDIVKSYDLELPDSEQYYDYNSQLAIWLGKIFNYSPAKIDNFISGYFAGLGTQVTNIIDWILSQTGTIPEKPNMGLESNSIGKRFFINANTNSASVDELYGLKTELTKKKNGNTISDEETQQLESINNAISNMSKLNKQIKEIKKDLTISGKEKAEKIKILQKQKTDTARSALGKEVLYPENETNNERITFYPSQNTLSQNGYVLNLTSDMKKEYEQLAYNKYKQYENHGLYSKEKLEKLKEKSKDYAKSQLIKKYKNDLIKK